MAQLFLWTVSAWALFGVIGVVALAIANGHHNRPVSKGARTGLGTSTGSELPATVGPLALWDDSTNE